MSEPAAPSKERRPSGLREVRSLVQELFPVRPAVYWADMLSAAAAGWAAFALAVARPGWGFCALPLAVLALYRAVLFVHELTHVARAGVPGFQTVWNLLVGGPMLLPSFTYVGVHTDHHRRTIYGTPRDPEYLPLGLPPRTRIVRFMLEPLVMPLLFVLRFVVLVPFALVLPPLHRVLERHASSLAINITYRRREPTAEERRAMMLQEGLCCAIWICAAVLAWRGTLPWRIFPTWYVVSIGIAVVNQVRTLGAHRYRNAGESMDVVGQLLDSVNVPGGLWTELWAPVGLRYHALHHYLPDMPYHSLGRAHRRLMHELPEDAPYRHVNAGGLWEALGGLWAAAGGRT